MQGTGIPSFSIHCSCTSQLGGWGEGWERLQQKEIHLRHEVQMVTLEWRKNEFLLHTLFGNHQGCFAAPKANTQVTPLTSIFWCLVFVHLLPLQLPPSTALSVIPFLWPSGEKNEILNFEPALLLLKPIVFLRLSCAVNSLSRAGYKHTRAHAYNSNKTNNVFFRNVHSH